MSPEKGPGLYKISLMAYRNPKLSEEEYHYHWTNVHAPKVKQWLAKHGVVRYTQYHTPSWIRNQAGDELKTMGEFAKKQVIDYDGVVEILVPEIEIYEKARKDPYYTEVVKPDEEYFFDISRSYITIGWEETYVDGGEALAQSKESSVTDSSKRL